MAAGRNAAWVPCRQCPLKTYEGLRALSDDQVAFMQNFKQGEMSVARGTDVLVQGSISPHIYTVLNGVLIRNKSLEDGRRQILNFVFPGDLIGLQGATADPLQHGVEALSEAKLCVFSRERVFELFREQPHLGFDVAWLAAKEEAALEEHLTSLGRRTARERIAFLGLFLFLRGLDTGRTQGATLKIAVTQAQVADTVGLSLVHTNRTLQSLRRAGDLFWSAEEIRIPNLERVREIAKYDLEPRQARPYV